MSIRTRGRFITSVLALAVIAGVGGYGTYAAFTGTTSNSANSFTAGTVSLTDNDSNGAMVLSTAPMNPGETYERCITVTNNGSLPVEELELSFTTTGSTDLRSAVNVDIERANGTITGTFPSCTGMGPGSTLTSSTLENLSISPIADPGATSALTPGGSLTYRFRYGLPSAAPTSLEGTSNDVTVTWTARS